MRFIYIILQSYILVLMNACGGENTKENTNIPFLNSIEEEQSVDSRENSQSVDSREDNQSAGSREDNQSVDSREEEQSDFIISMKLNQKYEVNPNDIYIPKAKNTKLKIEYQPLLDKEFITILTGKAILKQKKNK